jgi:HSP20 family molecular chaperone IbpA
MFGLQKKAVENETDKHAAATQNSVTYVPAVDVTENETGYTIFADVPGADKDSVDVTFEDGVVTLKANSAATKPVEGAQAIHREFRLSGYERAFRVGDDVDVEKINAEIANGVLKVSLPRKASAKKVISVSAK